MTLQTKYILRLVLLLLIAGMGFLWYLGSSAKKREPRPVLPEQELAQKVDTQLLAQVNLDSDSDGLKDWEEALWKTNDRLADTDGDGTYDGKEVAEGRDPTKKGPNDILPVVKSGPSEKEILIAKNSINSLTTTDKIARETFTAYLAAKNSTAGAGQLQASIDDIIADANSSGVAITYSLKDLKIVNDSSTSFLKLYGDKVGETINTNDSVFSYNELSLFENAIKSGKATDFAKLDEPYRAYLSIANGMRSMQVPSIIASRHLELMNSFYQLAGAVSNMKSFQNDPIVGMLGIDRFKEGYSNMSLAAEKLLSSLSVRNVTYDTSDSGYALKSL